jgi:hypothetical protein
MKRRRSNILLIAVLSTLLITLNGQKLDLDKDIELDIAGEVIGNKLVTFLSPYFGRSAASPAVSQRASLIVDLTFDRVMIANKQGSTYGIQCTQDLFCEISGFKDACIYQEVPLYDCQQGSVLVKYKETKVNDYSIAQMTAFFYNSTDFWETRLGKHGVLGLNPSSPVWSYFDAAYNKQPGQESIESSLSYKVKDSKTSLDPSTLVLTESFFTVNGRAGINDPVLQSFNRSKYQTAWVFEGATINYDGKTERKNSSLCVDNTQNAYLLSANASAIKSAILTTLCGRSDACTRAKSDLSKLSDITVGFTGTDGKKFTMSVRPDEYVNFDAKDNAVVGVQDIAGSKCSAVGHGVSDAIGRLMLTKIEFVVRVYKVEDRQTIRLEIGFNEISYPKDLVFLIILIVLGVIILLIIMGIMIVSSLAKKKATEEESDRYHKPEDVDN